MTITQTDVIQSVQYDVKALKPINVELGLLYVAVNRSHTDVWIELLDTLGCHLKECEDPYS